MLVLHVMNEAFHFVNLLLLESFMISNLQLKVMFELALNALLDNVNVRHVLDMTRFVD